MACKCQKCGNEYKLDLLIPDEIWSKITLSKNKEAGLLCPVCIVTELEKIYGYSMFKLSDGNQLQLDNGKLPIPHVRFQLPSDQQIVELAILFNDGNIDKEILTKMVSLADFIIDRLYENGDVSKPSSKEGN